MRVSLVRRGGGATAVCCGDSERRVSRLTRTAIRRVRTAKSAKAKARATTGISKTRRTCPKPSKKSRTSGRGSATKGIYRTTTARNSGTTATRSALATSTRYTEPLLTGTGLRVSKSPTEQAPLSGCGKTARGTSVCAVFGARAGAEGRTNGCCVISEAVLRGS